MAPTTLLSAARRSSRPRSASSVAGNVLELFGLGELIEARELVRS